MDPLTIGEFIILVLALVSAGFAWQIQITRWCCLAIAALDLAMMLHIGPW